MTARRKIFGLAALLGFCLTLTPPISTAQAGETIVIGPQVRFPGVVLHVDNPYPQYRRVAPGPPLYHGPFSYYYSDDRGRLYPHPGPLYSYRHYDDRRYYDDRWHHDNRSRYRRDRYDHHYPPPGYYRDRDWSRDRYYYPDDDRRYRTPPPRVRDDRYRTDTYKEERRSKTLQERRWSR